jgi:hypothetical protein
MTRRSFTIAAAALLAISLNIACTGKHGTSTVVQNDEGEPVANAPIVSRLKMSDASAKDQLISGFYALENGVWRWTAGKFSVTLKTPPGASPKGATLTLALTVSDLILKQVHSQTLSVSVGKTVLKSEKYVDAGSHTFTADIPASALTGDTVTVNFSLDHVLPPSANDRRELGVIVTSVGIESN